ncbi:hypothetical protein CWM47_01690 [Spirosoma pollinicola]|uniref:Uncharacterized protein n=2 Tax=Spirosoma pollinicola TaxID=2057025 RepID=A0A2K8YSN5_9BACT|nr:hypothetical protein CWM47_01690 [Spirosoma pollinicola]
MIRYITSDGVYYSLKDITNWFSEQSILTTEQNQLFSFRCRAHMAQKLAYAYKEYSVFGHMEPIILPVHDYFIHWVTWANLLTLLPGETGNNPTVHSFKRLLDDPETVAPNHRMKFDIKLVCLDDKLAFINVP